MKPTAAMLSWSLLLCPFLVTGLDLVSSSTSLEASNVLQQPSHLLDDAVRSIIDSDVLSRRGHGPPVCVDFVSTKKTDTTTGSMPATGVEDCLHAGDAACGLSVTVANIKFVTHWSSKSDMELGDIDFDALFGPGFVQSKRRDGEPYNFAYTLQEGESGYVGVYSLATQFDGYFRDCNGIEASAVVLRDVPLVYHLVLTEPPESS